MSAAAYNMRVQRAPQGGSQQRAPGPAALIPPQRPKTAQMAHQTGLQNSSRHEHEEAAKKSKAPTDKTMPNGIEDIIIGDGVAQYKQMCEVERRLDAIIMRKRLQILNSDSEQKNARRHRKMRIWVSNTVENQPWQGAGELDEAQFDFDTGIEATYRVKIEGRLLPNGGEEETATAESSKMSKVNATNHDPTSDAQKSPKPHTRLSDVFKKITIDFDRSRSLQPETMTAVEWEKPVKDLKTRLTPTADFDCLEFERKSDENINCTIRLYRHEAPERYTLSDGLADIVDSKEEDRTSILMKIWEYVRTMGLQQEEDKRVIRCDERLKTCFRKDMIFFPEISQLIMDHLSSPAPISLPYTIRVDQEFHASPSPTIYDVLVPAPPERTLPMSQTWNEDLGTLADLDSLLPEVIQALQQSKAKHSFLRSLAQDPTTFLKKWIKSQRRDMEIMLGDDQQQSEVWKKGGNQGIWGSEQVRESVGLLVQRESK